MFNLNCLSNCSALGRATIGGFQRLCSNGVIWLLTSFVVVNGAIQYFTHRISRSTDRSSHSNNNNPENESPTDHHDSDNETFTNWLTSYSRRNPSVSIANLLAMSQPVTNPLDVVFRQGRNFRGVFSSGSSDDGNETDTNGNGVQIDEVQHRRILSLLSHLEIGANFLYLRPESISYDYVFDLPVFKFHKNSSECLNGQQKMGTSESCAICLDEYEPEEELCNLPCAHGYHRRCIVAWLFRDQPVCPVCRWPAYKQKF